MKNVVKIYLSFVENYLLKAYYDYVFIGVLALILVLDILFAVLKWNKRSFSKSTRVLTFILFLLIFGEWYVAKNVFSSLQSGIFVSLTLLVVQLLISTALFLIKVDKKPKGFKPQEKKAEDIKIQALNYGETIKNAVEKLKLSEEEPRTFSGFVDVAYIKSLINELNGKDLEEKDKLEIEELEVYLLNFINRQPNSLEREVLSRHLGGLIKKLAKYQVV